MRVAKVGEDMLHIELSHPVMEVGTHWTLVLMDMILCPPFLDNSYCFWFYCLAHTIVQSAFI
jgi:hypothetical protein